MYRTSIRSLSYDSRVIHTNPFRAVGQAALSLLAGICALTVAPSMIHAAQFVLFDVTFTYSKTDADTSTPSKSHYYVRGAMLNPDRPRDWTAPVDYRNGTVHIRAEVIEKPAGGEKTTWTKRNSTTSSFWRCNPDRPGARKCARFWSR
jgi:hypothetical protein